MSPFCNYFGYLFVTYCLNNNISNNPSAKSVEALAPIKAAQKRTFDLEYQWQFVNFTWPSRNIYVNAINYGYYIPENVAMTGIKYYRDSIYFALPRIRRGVPATLGKMVIENSTTLNPLIKPYPNWEANAFTRDCSALQSVHSMEIDRNGIMWVLDGFRTNNITKCPPKLVLLDLNNKGNEILSYIFPKEVCSFQGGFLSDIVLDESDNGYAYITDNSRIDPGLIIYSKTQNRAWKLRDRTMFDEENASNFVIGNSTFDQLSPLDGIALSPLLAKSGNKILYYSSLAGMNLYSIDTKVLKNEHFLDTGEWRRAIKVIGKKQGQSDGLIIDNEGNLYYTLPPLYGVGRWNINTPFSSAQIIIKDKKKMIWPSSFTFDDRGNLRLLASSFNKFIDDSIALTLSKEVLFRIFKLFTGTKSYLS